MKINKFSVIEILASCYLIYSIYDAVFGSEFIGLYKGVRFHRETDALGFYVLLYFDVFFHFIS